jgi:chromosome segregation ATPase
MESVKDLWSYIKYMLLKEGEVLELDGRVFKKGLEADEVRLRKYLVRKNNNAANAAMNKKIKLDKDQLNKDGMTKDLSEQLKEKEAIIENLRNKLKEMDELYEKNSRLTRRENDQNKKLLDQTKRNEQLNAQVKELTAKVNAQSEDQDRFGRLKEQLLAQSKQIFHDNEQLLARKNELIAQVKEQEDSLKANGGYKFGSTGTVIDRDKQVSVVLCLLLHFDKSRGLIFMCHILKYPSTMIRCSKSIFCRRQATTRMR